MLRRILLAFGLLGILLGGYGLWRHWATHPPASARLVMLPAQSCEGLSQGEVRILEVLLEDALETTGGCSVVRMVSLPPPEAWGPGPEGYVFRIAPRRVGSDLILDLDIGSTQACRRGEALRRISAPTLPPQEAMAWLFRQLPGHPTFAAGTLAPAQPSEFWELLEAFAASRGPEAEPALARLVEGGRRDPHCAAWPAALGYALLAAAQTAPLSGRFGAKDLEAALDQALERAPGLPRAVVARVNLLVERGSVREAMGILEAAHRLRPRSARLLTGLEYAARYAGALDLALAADAEFARRCLGLSPGRALSLSRLYQGDLEGFGRSLQPGLDPRNTATLLFFKGYLALLRGDREGAIREFASAEGGNGGIAPVKTLAQGYRLALMGSATEAKGVFQELSAARNRLLLPDGEFLLRLAEGFALIGELDQAMDLTQQAFQHGFGCARWFEASPFLTPLRSGSRWVGLRDHLRAREALVGNLVSPGSWGL